MRFHLHIFVALLETGDLLHSPFDEELVLKASWYSSIYLGINLEWNGFRYCFTLYLQRKAEEVKPYLNGRSMYLVGQFLCLFLCLAPRVLSGYWTVSSWMCIRNDGFRKDDSGKDHGKSTWLYILWLVYIICSFFWNCVCLLSFSWAKTLFWNMWQWHNDRGGHEWNFCSWDIRAFRWECLQRERGFTITLLLHFLCFVLSVF